jgi:hypothetical protein
MSAAGWQVVTLAVELAACVAWQPVPQRNLPTSLPPLSPTRHPVSFHLDFLTSREIVNR